MDMEMNPGFENISDKSDVTGTTTASIRNSSKINISTDDRSTGSVTASLRRSPNSLLTSRTIGIAVITSFC